MQQQQKSSLLGKSELLHWAAEASGVYPCSKYDDLKDGLVFLALFERLFPVAVNEGPSLVKTQKNGGPRQGKSNWEALRNGMAQVGLPVQICDRRGVQAGHQRPVYNMLVMFYFLTKLTASNEFSVDFAHPIDDALSQFLQSQESLEVLARAGAANSMHDRMRGISTSPSHPIASPTKSAAAPSTDPDAAHHHHHHHPMTADSVYGGVLSSNAGTSGAKQPLASKGAVVAESSSGRVWGVEHDPKLPMRGELVVTRLKGQFDRALRAQEYFEEQLKLEKQISAMALDHEHRMADTESARWQQELAHQRALAEVAKQSALQKVRKQCFDALTAALDDIAVERDSAAIEGANSVEGQRVELTHLRQTKTALEAQVLTLQASLRDRSAANEVTMQQLQQSTALLEKVLKSHRGVVAALSGDTVPDILFEHASDAEQSAVLLKIKKLQVEVATARVTGSRLEEQLQLARETNNISANHDEASVQMSIELARTKALLEKARASNAFLRDGLARLQMGDSIVIEGNNDYAAEDLGQGIIAPSVMIKAIPADEVCASTHRAISVVKAALASSASGGEMPLAHRELEDLSSQFWRLSGAFSALQRRLQAASMTIKTLNRELGDAKKHNAVQSFNAEKTLADAQRHAQRSIEDAIRSSHSELSQTRLELQLVKQDRNRLQDELTSAHDRAQQSAAAVITDADRRISELRDQVSTLQRQNTVLKRRDEVYQQMQDMYRRDTARMTLGEKQMHDAKMDHLLQQLQSVSSFVNEASRVSAPNVASGTSTGPLSPEEVETAIATATRNVRERMQALAGELRQMTEKHNHAESKLAAAVAEAEQLRLDLTNERQSKAEVEHMAENIKDELARLGHAAAEAKAMAAATIKEAQQDRAELEAYARDVAAAVTGASLNGGGGSSAQLPMMPSSAMSERGHLFRSTAEEEQQHSSFSAGGAGGEKRFSSFAQGGGGHHPMSSAASFTSSIGANEKPASSHNTFERQLFVPPAASPFKLPEPTHEPPQPTVVSMSGRDRANSSVLSAAELEKRKQEILAKYGVRTN